MESWRHVPDVRHIVRVTYKQNKFLWFFYAAALAWWIVTRSKTLAQGTKEDKQIGHGLEKDTDKESLIVEKDKDMSDKYDRPTN